MRDASVIFREEQCSPGVGVVVLYARLSAQAGRAKEEERVLLLAGWLVGDRRRVGVSSERVGLSGGESEEV